LTHVCRYWRNSITSVPANWTLISNLDKDLTALSLERANTASLSVCLDMDRWDPGFFGLLAPYVQNIDTLRVTSPTTIKKLRQALPKFPRSTPNLRSLSLNSDVHWGGSTDPFGSLAPTLRYLELGNIPLYPSLLRLKSLTALSYVNGRFDLPLDILLDFLEGNRLLEHVALGINFRTACLLSSRRRTAMENRLRCLSIYYRDVMSTQAIISSIALRKGARLNIIPTNADRRLNDILSGVCTAHLWSLRSPTFIEYRSYPRSIQLFGPNGQFLFQMPFNIGGGVPFVEFPLLRLTHIREFRLVHRLPEGMQCPLQPLSFDQSYFPALETLAVDCETDLSHLFSGLFSNPSSPSSLQTIAFMDCDLTEDFMKELTQYASKRKATTSAWLYKVVIVHSDGKFPFIATIRKLGEHVPVIDVRVGMDLPRDFS
jgi:hypothetical protein